MPVRMESAAARVKTLIPRIANPGTKKGGAQMGVAYDYLD